MGCKGVYITRTCFRDDYFSGNPNNWYGNEDCGEIWPNSDKGDFNDKDCSTTQPYLCQKKGNLIKSSTVHIKMKVDITLIEACF